MVSENQSDCDVLAQVLLDWKLKGVCCHTFHEVMEISSFCPVLLAFCDSRKMETDPFGFHQLIRHEPRMRVVALVSENVGTSAYHAAIQMGAFNVIASPCHRADVQWTILSALRDRGAHEEIGSNARFQSQEYQGR